MAVGITGTAPGSESSVTTRKTSGCSGSVQMCSVLLSCLSPFMFPPGMHHEARVVHAGFLRRERCPAHEVKVRAVVALPLPAAREALGAPPSPSLHGLDTSLDGGSQHGLPEPHDAYQGGT